jgi:hypothetical protein
VGRCHGAASSASTWRDPHGVDGHVVTVLYQTPSPPGKNLIWQLHLQCAPTRELRLRSAGAAFRQKRIAGFERPRDLAVARSGGRRLLESQSLLGLARLAQPAANPLSVYAVSEYFYSMIE